MPISSHLLQRRHTELGRIRLGARRPGAGGAPVKLDAFRITSPTERYVRDLASLYGGEPRPWDNHGVPSFEVYTRATSLPVIVVAGGLSQWMETWSGGGCVHRCDGVTDASTGALCDPMDRAHVDAQPTTRLSVMLLELAAIGVWRLESHGWNAAAEMPAVADLAAYVGDLVPAHLHLVERRRVKDGRTSRFVVPVLDLQIGADQLRELVTPQTGRRAEVLETAAQPRALPAPEPEHDTVHDTALRSPAVQHPTLSDVRQASSTDAVYAIYRYLLAHDALTDELHAACRARRAELEAIATTTGAPVDGAGPYAAHHGPGGEPVAAFAGDGGAENAEWERILAAAAQAGMSTADLEDDFLTQMGGVSSAEASLLELQTYLRVHLGAVPAGQVGPSPPAHGRGREGLFDGAGV